MALTAAERAKGYRDRCKSNPAGRAKFLEKDRNRKKTEYVPIVERNDRCQRKARRHWRASTKKRRAAMKHAVELPETPPSTPLLRNAGDTPPFVPPPPVDQRTKRGRKKVKKMRSKALRDLKTTQSKLHNQEKLTGKWKKRFNRMKKRMMDNAQSPRSRTRKLLRHCHVNDEVRKKLMFHHVICKEVGERYRQNKSQRDKQKMRRLTANGICKKYRMMNRTAKVIGSNRRDIRKGVNKDLEYERAVRSDKVCTETQTLLNSFFERDDISRQMPGKSDTITRNKIKKQKRLLNENLSVLHTKFMYENPNITMHYSTFCMIRPWWVVKPTLSDLDSCMCKRCTNMDLIHQKLAIERVTTTLEESMKSAVCDIKRKQCMYGECGTCREKRVPFPQVTRGDKEIEYQQWITQERSYGDGKSSNVTVKATFKASLSSLCDKYEAELKHRYTTHHFNIYHQYAELRKLKANLDEKSVIVHIDFSENYICRYAEEIQSVHFGGSHQQASLHTGVYYTSDGSHAFCTISDCTRHDPAGIWGHLDPILQDIQKRYPVVTTVHFISDGPTTQYRNKTNFWLASTFPKSMGFEKVTWNFMEAGHGKGAPDGIGGVLKRTADSHVAQGKDIRNAQELYETLKPLTSIDLILVTEEDIKRFDAEAVIPKDLLTVQGTMKIHQVLFTDDPNTVKHRELSCFCGDDLPPCFKTTEARLRQEMRPHQARVRQKRVTEEVRATEEETTGEETADKETTDNQTADKETTEKETTEKETTEKETTEKETPTEEETTNDETTEAETTEERATKESTINPTVLKPVTYQNAKIGDYCVVLYKGKPYPGVIEDIDTDSVEIKSMSRVGNNRFFWPMREDKIWYTYDNIVTWIPPPEKVASRHHQVALAFWEEIIVQLGGE